MTLTKQDLEAIGTLIDEKLDAKLDKFEARFQKKLDELESRFNKKLENLDVRFEEKLAKAVKQIVGAHLLIVHDMEGMERDLELVMAYLELAPRSRKLREAMEETKRVLGV